MSGIIATAQSSVEFKQIDPGVYPARCFSIIDLGTHKSDYMWQEKIKHQIRIGWEFPTELTTFGDSDEEKPFALFKTYTLSLSEKANLRKDLESWRGKQFNAEELEGFDLSNVLGKPCQIQVLSVPDKKDSTRNYSTISSIMWLPKGMTCPDQVNPSVFVSQEDWTDETFSKMSPKLVEKIKESMEYNTQPVEQVKTAKEVFGQPEVNVDELPY